MAFCNGTVAATIALICTVFSVASLSYISITARRAQTPDGQSQFRGRELLADSRGLLEDESVVGTLVELTGNKHMETTQWLKTASGAFQKQRMLHRPGWSKSIRCKGATSESCEECVGSTDCWTPNVASRTVRTTGSEWTRFTSVVHVRCNAPTITVNYEIRSLLGGRLRLFWDNVEINPVAGFETQGLASPMTDGQTGSGNFSIDVAKVGGHTLEVEFVGLAAGASIELSKLELVVPDSYAQCEDFKACLDPLAMDEATMELRSSNSLQLKCLENPTTEECVMWQYCLVKSDRREAILSLLRAGGVDRIELPGASADDQATMDSTTSETTTDLNVTTTANPTENVTVQAAATQAPHIPEEQEGTCINPLLEDAESWACDCYDEMRERCEQLSSESFYTNDLCMRALVCDHPHVCSEWKAQACDVADPALQLMQDKLQHRRLLERSFSPQAGEADGLDRALTGKKCT